MLVDIRVPTVDEEETTVENANGRAPGPETVMRRQRRRQRRSGSWIDTQAARGYAARLVWMTVLADYALSTLLIPVLPYAFPDTRPGSALFNGFLFASRPLFQLLLSHWLVDAAGSFFTPAMVFWLGLLMFCSSAALFVVAQESWPNRGALLSARILHALASSMVMQGGISFIKAMFSKARAKRYVDTVMPAVSFGVLFGPICGGLGIQFGSHASVFTVFAAIAAVLLVTQ
jgi:MFS family permease